MIVHRFMSLNEYGKLISGKRLTNNTQHAKKTNGTSKSFGFCFFTEAPEDAVHWLSGIATLDVCVSMEVADGFLVKSSAQYRDVDKDNYNLPLWLVPKMRKTEYCRCAYSLNDVKIINVTDKFRRRYPTAEEIRKILNI